MLGMSEMWVILILALLFFGGSQIPKLARSLGRARKEFEEGAKEGAKELAEEYSGKCLKECGEADNKKLIDNKKSDGAS
jgi:sec-independent protein translocase protein TatA